MVRHNWNIVVGKDGTISTYRIFEGKRFYHEATVYKKSDADELKKKLVKKGFMIRVVKIGDGWKYTIWTRRK